MYKNFIAILFLFAGFQVHAGLIQLDSVGTKVDVHIIGDTDTYIDEGTADKYHQSYLEYDDPDPKYGHPQYGTGSAEADTLAGTLKNYAESSGANVSAESDLRSQFTVIDDDPSNYNSSVSVQTSVDGIFSGDISGGTINFQTRLSLCADSDCNDYNDYIYGGVNLGLFIEGTNVWYINERPYGYIDDNIWNPNMVEIESTGLVVENDYLGSGDTYVSILIDITLNEVEHALTNPGSPIDFDVSFADFTHGEVWNQLDLFMGSQIGTSGFMDFSHTVESDLEFINATAVPISGDGLLGSSSSQVPEPSILALMGVGLAGLGFARRKRKAQA